MNRNLAILAGVLLLALLAGLWWRRADPDGADHAGKPEEAPRVPSSAATGGEPDKESAQPDPVPAGAQKLHGLRLLPKETATARGWTPPPPLTEPSDPVSQTHKLLSHTKIRLNSSNQPLPELLRHLETTYGIRTRLDPHIEAESKTVTFKVEDLAADQGIDLVMKMAGLGWAVDAAGEIWITSKARAAELAAPLPPDPDPWFAAFAKLRWQHDVRWDSEPHLAFELPWKGKKVTVSIVRKPLPEAWDDLMKALDVGPIWTSRVFRKETRERTALLLPVSLVAEDMPAEDAVAEILRGSGLDLEDGASGANFLLPEEVVKQRREAQEKLRKAREDYARELAAFRARRVRINGEVLSANDVISQVASQLGVTLRIALEVAHCGAAWESDGLEQSAGEVLDILARDGGLLWRWAAEPDPAAPDNLGPRCLWVMGVAEK